MNLPRSVLTLALFSLVGHSPAEASAPIAVADTFGTTMGTALVVAAPGTLANDVDLDGEGFIMSSVTLPTHGTLTSAVTNGAFTYVPDPGFVGTDQFTYVLRDDSGEFSASGTVTIEVIPDPNRLPLAVSDSYAILQNQTLTVTAPGTRQNDIDPDGDGFIMSSVTLPTYGTLTSAVTNGAFTYVPNTDFVGTDEFTYILRDDSGAFSESGLVTIMVLPPGGTIPVAVADTYATTEGMTLTVLAPGTRGNDIDPDGEGFIMSSVTLPTHGTLTSAVTNGAFTYVPNPGFVGTDEFTYILRDDSGNFSAPGVVTIMVLPDSNRPPLALADAYVTPVDTPLTVVAPGTRGNDIDPDGDSFIMSSVTLPTHGVLTSAVTNGAFTYVPNPGFVGTDEFTYILRDDSGAFSEPGRVTIRAVVSSDLTPPEISLLSQTLVLAKPNHMYHTLHVTDLVASVYDEGDPLLSPSDVVITRVTSDEADDAYADGNTLDDIVIGNTCNSVALRAERQGTGNGRVYVVELAVRDTNGNVGTASIEVQVPRDAAEPAVKDAPALTVDGSCAP